MGGRIELRHVGTMVRQSFLASLGLWLRSPKVILKPLKSSRDKVREMREVEQDPYFDYGARTTALDRVRSHNDRRYFQLLDRQMYVKVLERTVLDTIAQILDQHNISTADFVENRATIINNGVMIGSVRAENVAMAGGVINRSINRVRGATGAASASAPPPS
jgi:hypothetical protein